MTSIPPELLAYVTGFHRERTDPTPREDLRASPMAWDRFNGSATNDYTAGLMEALGWTITGHTRQGVINLERPGKDEGSTSATVGAVAEGVLYVHTSSDPTFSEGTPYDAADIYAISHHGGDRAATDAAFVVTYGGSRRFLSDVEVEVGLESYRRQGEAAREAQRAIQVVTRVSSWESIAYSIEDLRKLPPLTWAIDGWIPEESLSAIYGARKAGKTFTAISMVCAMAAGLPWFGAQTIQQNVAYVVGEGVRGYQRRADAWCLANGVEPANITFLDAAGRNLRDPETYEGLIEYMLAHDKTFFVVDTLNRLAGGLRENDSDGMGEFTQAMDTVRAETKATSLLVHHSGKDPSQGMRGHSSLEGAVDAAIAVTKKDQNLPFITVKLELAREIESGATIPFELYVPDGAKAPTLRFSEREEDQHGDSSMKRVLDVIRQAGRPVDADYIAEYADLSKRHAQSYARQLRDSHQVVSNLTDTPTTYSVSFHPPPIA